MTKITKRWIDAASYEQLLHKWRFTPIGDPFFDADTTDYYRKTMHKRREALGHARAAAVSKKIGWG